MRDERLLRTLVGGFEFLLLADLRVGLGLDIGQFGDVLVESDARVVHAALRTLDALRALAEGFDEPTLRGQRILCLLEGFERSLQFVEARLAALRGCRLTLDCLTKFLD